MTGYVRTDITNNISDGSIINAADLDNEFDALVAAFHNTTGHTHDGTAANGAGVTAVGPAQDVVVSTTSMTPKTTNAMDIGSSGLKFKDLYLAGNETVGGTLNVTGVTTLTAKPTLSSLTASQAVFTDSSKGLVSNAVTGTGNVVMSNSPTLVTPTLGTPASGTLTNATGLPLSTGVTGFLSVDKGGTGATTLTGVVKGNGTSAFTAATAGTDYVAPGGALGTPSSGTLTNATGLPLSTGVTGTLPVTNGGTGNTSYTDGQLLIGNSTGNTLTKATLTAGSGVAITNGGGSITIAATGSGGTVTNVSVVSANGLAGSVANASSTPAITLSTNVNGVVKGDGTSFSAATAGTDYVAPGGALGTPSSGTLTNATGLPLSTGVTGTLPVGNGGTGATTLTGVLKGNGTSAFTAATAGTDYVAPGGALGTPSSGTLTNATGLPLSTGVTGTLPVGNGGTGATTLTGLVKGNGTSAFTAATANTDYLVPALANTAVTGFKTATFNSQTTIATATGAITVDWTSAQNQKQTEPTGTITYTFTAPPGPCHLQLLIDSDGTSTAQTINWPGTVIWLGATWTATSNKKAIINFWYDGTNYYTIGTNQA